MTEIDLWADEEELEFEDSSSSPLAPSTTTKVTEEPIEAQPLPPMAKKALLRIKQNKLELFVKGNLRAREAINGDLGSIYSLEEEMVEGVRCYRCALTAVNAFVLRHVLKGLDLEIAKADAEELSSYANKIKNPVVKLADTGKHAEILAPNVKAYQDILKKVNAYPVKGGYRVGISRVMDLEILAKQAVSTLPPLQFNQEVLKLNREPIPGFDGTLDSLKLIPIGSLNVISSNLQQYKQIKSSNKTLEEKFAAFGIANLHDLLFTLPKKFIDKSNPQELEDLMEGESATIVGKVTSVGEMPNRMGVNFVVENGRARSIKTTFWRQVWLKTKFKVGDEVLITGKVTRFKGKIELGGASIEHADEAAILPIVPVYKQSPSSGMTTQIIMAAAREMLARIDKIQLPGYLKKAGRMDYTQALTELHFPTAIDTFKAACDDLAYYELIYMQILMQEEKANTVEAKGLVQKEGARQLQRKAVKLLPFELTKSQKRGVVTIDRLMAEPKPASVLLNADVGSGKGLLEDESVLTPFGWTEVKSLKPGDLVVGRDGKPTRVLGVYPQGEQEVAKITFNDGTHIITDLAHRWTLIPMGNVNGRTGGPRAEKVITTGQLLSREKSLVEVPYVRGDKTTVQPQMLETYFLDNRGYSRWAVPLLSSPVEHPHRSDLSIDPYLLGYWLGDGLSRAGYLAVGKDDFEAVKALTEPLWPGEVVWSKDKRNGDYAIRFIKSEKQSSLTSVLKTEGLILNKHVPEKYMVASAEQRLSLLQGLIDSDGSVSKAGSAEFGNTNLRLVEAVAELVRSLGGTAKISTAKYKKYTNSKGERVATTKASYSVTINLPEGIVPSRLPRKAERYYSGPLTKKSQKLKRAIVNVELLPQKEKTVCIKVDAADELFVTKNYTVTHNTIIAQLACLRAVEAGQQAVLIGPTDILARQLFRTFESIQKLLSQAGEEIRVEFLDTKLKAKEKKEQLARIKNQEVDIIVGTTSVIGKSVKYANLGLVVIDEQQKFGAEQRTRLLAAREDGLVPDLVQQTATPIPRSTAQVFYGDMEMILLDEKPPGRIPIVTEWIEEDPIEFAAQLANPVWSDIQNEADKGNQTFVITPMVKDSDKVDAASVERTFKNLSEVTLAGLNVAYVHGRVPLEEQKQIMEDFRAKKYDVLVASLVVEVGVDIPDATRVVILSADRLGAASLHQIRGRVGRNSKPSKCYLVSLGKTDNSRLRLQSLVDSENGFDIALADLDVRGEGKMFSTEQSGSSDMIFASLARHKDRINDAKEEAEEILKSSYRNVALEDARSRFSANERLF